MWRAEERRELKREVLQRGRRVAPVAARLGVPVSTAQRWIRLEKAKSAASKPTFVEVVAETIESPSIVIRVGGAAIEVQAGFDVELLRQIVTVLGDGA